MPLWFHFQQKTFTRAKQAGEYDDDDDDSDNSSSNSSKGRGKCEMRENKNSYSLTSKYSAVLSKSKIVVIVVCNSVGKR